MHTKQLATDTTRIGEYPVVRRLGAGGMGEVYLVRHPRLPRMQAIKVLRTAAAPSNPDALARFEREADILARLTHPHIVGVYDRGWAGDRPWISMEYVPGMSVGQSLSQGPMPPDAALTVLRATAAALDYAWTRHRVVHRDVKPDNILVVGHWPRIDDVKVADFGIAKVTDRPADITAFGMAVGTVGYAAPEVLSGQPCDDRSDQYGLAATAFAALTGSAPYRGDRTAILDAQLTRPVPAASSVNPLLPRGVDRVLARGMSARPEHRFPTSLALVAAVERALLEPAPALAAPERSAEIHGHAQRRESVSLRAPACNTSTGPRGATFSRPAGRGRSRRRQGLVALAVAVALAGGTLVATADYVSNRPTAGVPAASDNAMTAMPDFRGMSIDEASARGEDLGLTVRVGGTGTGTVVVQSPAPGATIPGRAVVWIADE